MGEGLRCGFAALVVRGGKVNGFRRIGGGPGTRGAGTVMLF